MSLKLAEVILAIASCVPTFIQPQMHAGPQLPVPRSIEVPKDGVTIPMQNMGGRPVVELKINGKGPYRFILDTGATTTVVSDELSQELSLSAPAGVQAVPTGGGPAPAIISIHEIRIGDATLQDLIAVAMPLSGLLKGENAPRGILSASTFPGYLLTFDYPHMQILIKKGALESVDSRSSFQYSEDQVLPTVPIRVAGRDTQVHLDTGSGYGLTLPVKFLSELPLASQPKEAGKVRTGGGEFPVSTARVAGTIELGNYKLDPDEVRFSDAKPGPGPAVGNIGFEVLRHFVVTLDSQDRRIRLEQ